MTALHWRVGEAPTGRYRSFQHRAWPMAYHDRGRLHVAAMISCADSYTPERARTGQHAELRVRIADHSQRTTDGRPTFEWRLCIKRVATLNEAKALAERVLAAHPHFLPAASNFTK